MKKQRLWAVLACLALLLCLLPGAALADGSANDLQGLINGTSPGGTLKLGDDYSASGWAVITVEQNLILDLNGHSLTNLQLCVGVGGKVTLFHLINTSGTTPSVVSVTDPTRNPYCIQVSRIFLSMNPGEFMDVQIGSGLIGAAKSVQIESSYNGIKMLEGGKVTLNGVKVKAQNGVAFGYGSADNELTLTNTQIIADAVNPSDTTQGIRSESPLTLRLAGTNTVTSPGIAGLSRCGIFCGKKLTIIGPGRLDVASGETTGNTSDGITASGIEINGGATVTATGGTVGASSGSSFGLASAADPIVITNAAVAATGGVIGMSYGVYTAKLTLDNCSLIARTLATGGTRGALENAPAALVYPGGYRWRTAGNAAYNNGATIPYAFSASQNYLEILQGGVPLAFTHSDAFDVPAGRPGEALAAIDVSGGASGGTPGYTFSLAADAPGWLNISPAGVITGTRPGSPQGAATVAVYVQDSAKPTPSRTAMTIRVGETRDSTRGDTRGDTYAPPLTGDRFPLWLAWLGLGAAALIGVGWLFARKRGKRGGRRR